MDGHTPRTKDQLIELLEYMLTAVRHNDSPEGLINYVQPLEQDPPCDFMVQAAFRIGNRMGQGGMITVNSIKPASTSIVPSEVTGP